MQMATRCMHRNTRGGLPRSDAALPQDCFVGKRRLHACMPALSPRIDARRYNYGEVLRERKLIRDSGILPEQIQQVLRRCAGAGMSVLERPAGAGGDMFSFVPRAQGHANALRLAPLAQTFDPFRQHAGAQPVSFLLSLEGRQEVHWRTQPLCYTIFSDQQWMLLLGGTELAAMEWQFLSCAKVIFPANTVVQIRLAPRMLHGFEGRLAGICTAAHRPSRWRWQSSAPLAQEWPVSAWVEPGRVKVVADRGIPWELLQHWQQTVRVQRSPETIAWEENRMLLPF